MKPKIKTAIIDLYNNEVNEGMRCIKEIVTEANNFNIADVEYSVFDARYKGELPSADDYGIYISSGGPGNPYDGEGTKWERDYFNLLDEILKHNQANEKKKYFFFICHSFQIMNRYFKTALVKERPQKSFGVLPFEKTEAGKRDILTQKLPDIFYAADFRQYQVIQPDSGRLKELGASILAKEIDDGINESAVMALRISDEIAGTQFHPEADPLSMIYHLKQDERKDHITERYGEEKYAEMVEALTDPDKIRLTRKTVIPAFLKNALQKLTQGE